MNGKELLAKALEIMAQHETSAAELAREEYPEELEVAWKEALGEFKCIHHGRPPHGHDEMLIVYHFSVHDVYLAISGYYDSWSGTDWSDANLEVVVPEERKYTVYNTVK